MDEDFEKAIIKNRYEYYKKNQENYSDEANQILEEIKNGKEPNELEVFIITCNNENYIEQYREIYNYKVKIKEGTFDSEDLKKLLKTTFKNDELMQKMLYEAFIYKGLVKETENDAKKR